MKRREVVKGLVTAPAVWSTGAWAQPTERVRCVGVLVSARPGDAEYLALLGAFRQRMEELGWSEGRNLRIDLRWGGEGPDDVRKGAAELVGLRPDDRRSRQRCRRAGAAGHPHHPDRVH